MFLIDSSVGSITSGTQWLVWNFESDSTLGDALEGKLGPFPLCISDLFVRNQEKLNELEMQFRV